MSIFDQILNHDEQAKNRLISQYKDSENINKLIAVYTNQVQAIENATYAMLNGRTLDGSIGFQLDQLGLILNEKRDGLIDSDYRMRLKAKIAENTSEGTPEDLISIFKLLLNPDEIHYNEVHPAGFELTAIGNQDPVSSIDKIKKALEKAKPAGVNIINIKQVTRLPEFIFLEDFDESGEGFRDLSILYGLGQFELRDHGGEDTILTNPSIGDINDDDLGEYFVKILETDQTDELNINSGFIAAII
tara:strand:+ start:1112 stop:1849 length:738 start_codon:yes stop_codon:yes gene_type:complete